MPSPHRHTATSLSTQVAELAWAAPFVVAHRVTRMMLAGLNPSDRDRKEFTLMRTEKAAAFHESWHAMALHTWQAQQALVSSFVLAVWSPLSVRQPSATATASRLHDAALGAWGEGLAPVHRTALANARRLSRPQRR